MSVHWGGRGAGHISRWSLAKTGAPSLELNFLSGVLDPRITFSRGSNATLVDSTGKLTYAPANLFLQSQTFETASWNKNNATVTADATTAPDGTTTADALADTASSSSHFISQSVALSAVQKVVISLYAKANTLSRLLIRENSITGAFVSFDLSSGTILATSGAVTGSITSVGDGWYRCAIVQGIGTTGATSYGVFTLPAGGSTFANATYVGTGQSIYVWGAQSEIVTYQTAPSTYVATTAAAYYGPRFDYNPATLAARGLLIEQQRTNLLVRSSEFENAIWAAFGVKTVTANTVTSPDGTVNADTLSSVAGNGIAQQNIVISGSTAYTGSVYVKATTGTQVRLQLISSGGTGASTDQLLTISSGTNAGNGWYRLAINITSAAADNRLQMRILTDASANPIYIWGAQIETGAFATSYIPTSTAQATRSADIAVMTGTNFSSWYNASQGTFIAKYGASPNIFATYLAASNGVVAQNSVHFDNDSGGTMRVVYYSGSSAQATLSLGAYGTAGTVNTVATAYSVNNFAASRNGGVVVTDSSGAVPLSVSQLNIGADPSGAAVNVTNSHIASITYYNTRLLDSQLQALSL